MASKTVVELFDDLDGGYADETVSFALDGVDYEIDLSSANATELRGVLAQYVSHAHRVPNKAAKRIVAEKQPTGKPGKKPVGKSPTTGVNASLTAEIRRLASESARKVNEANAAREAEPEEQFEVAEIPMPASAQATDRQQEPVRALVIPFQEAGL